MSQDGNAVMCCHGDSDGSKCVVLVTAIDQDVLSLRDCDSAEKALKLGSALVVCMDRNAKLVWWSINGPGY
jgi:hypothetical protein